MVNIPVYTYFTKKDRLITEFSCNLLQIRQICGNIVIYLTDTPFVL